MLKYAKIINETTGVCDVGIGTNIDFYKSIGMSELDVTQSEIDGQWYLTEKLNTEECSKALEKKQNEFKKQEIQIQMNELDRKRIRALCEPELKDAESGITWLEYYNTEIQTLREQLNALE